MQLRLFCLNKFNHNEGIHFPSKEKSLFVPSAGTQVGNYWCWTQIAQVSFSNITSGAFSSLRARLIILPNRHKIVLLITLQQLNHTICTKSNAAQMRYSVHSVLDLPWGEVRCLSVFAQLVQIASWYRISSVFYNPAEMIPTRKACHALICNISSAVLLRDARWLICKNNEQNKRLDGCLWAAKLVVPTHLKGSILSSRRWTRASCQKTTLRFFQSFWCHGASSAKSRMMMLCWGHKGMAGLARTLKERPSCWNWSCVSMAVFFLFLFFLILQSPISICTCLHWTLMLMLLASNTVRVQSGPAGGTPLWGGRSYIIIIIFYCNNHYLSYCISN